MTPVERLDTAIERRALVERVGKPDAFLERSGAL